MRLCVGVTVCEAGIEVWIGVKGYRSVSLLFNSTRAACHGLSTPRIAGFPGYDTLMQKDTASVGEILKQRGWNTMWCGT